MKRALFRITAASYAVFFVAWGVIGLKILDHDYDFAVWAYIALVGLVAACLATIARAFTNRCPHCGKIHLSGGKYCSYCGKHIDNI